MSGQFAGLTEGDIIASQGDYDLRITYQAGSGNSIGLISSVPEPSSVLLISCIAGLAMLRRRKRM